MAKCADTIAIINQDFPQINKYPRIGGGPGKLSSREYIELVQNYLVWQRSVRQGIPIVIVGHYPNYIYKVNPRSASRLISLIDNQIMSLSCLLQCDYIDNWLLPSAPRAVYGYSIFQIVIFIILAIIIILGLVWVAVYVSGLSYQPGNEISQGSNPSFLGPELSIDCCSVNIDNILR